MKAINLKLNKNMKHVRKILEAVEKNDGYCPCQILKDEKSKCPFTMEYHPDSVPTTLLCINGSIKEECICKLYI